MSDDPDHTIATATVTSEEKPYGVRINTGGHALRGDERPARAVPTPVRLRSACCCPGSVPAPRSRCECTPNIRAGGWLAWMSS